MMKVTFVLAAVAVALTTSPPATPAKAQDLKMAQGVDVPGGTAPTGTVAGGMSGLHDWPFHINPH